MRRTCDPEAATRRPSGSLSLLLTGAFVLCGAIVACGLNPQPLPPGDTSDAGAQAPTGSSGSGSSSSGSASGSTGSSNGGSSSGTGSSGGGLEGDAAPPSDASVEGGASDSGEDGASPTPQDAASDAPTDGADGAPGDGATIDGGVLPDGGPYGCTTDPSGDAQCSGKPPHLMRCVFPYKEPAGCQTLSIGNATDLYCCP